MKLLIKFLSLILMFVFFACGSSNKVTSYKKKGAKTYTRSGSTSEKMSNSKTSSSEDFYRSKGKSFTTKDIDNLLKTAKSFLGSPYKYGGTTSTGFDCSGLVLVSFDQLGLKLPRNSSQQAAIGNEININDVRKGDLVFFNTSGRSISHVGIVEAIEKTGEIKFIHSSTSKGVIVSSMDEKYWKTRFVKATRLL